MTMKRLMPKSSKAGCHESQIADCLQAIAAELSQLPDAEFRRELLHALAFSDSYSRAGEAVRVLYQDAAVFRGFDWEANDNDSWSPF